MNKYNIIYNCIFKDRHNFNIKNIENIDDDEKFIYTILPYIARSSSGSH